jgi:hypothetical protein
VVFSRLLPAGFGIVFIPRRFPCTTHTALGRGVRLQEIPKWGFCLRENRTLPAKTRCPPSLSLDPLVLARAHRTFLGFRCHRILAVYSTAPPFRSSNAAAVGADHRIQTQHVWDSRPLRPHGDRDLNCPLATPLCAVHDCLIAAMYFFSPRGISEESANKLLLAAMPAFFPDASLCAWPQIRATRY